MSDEKMRVRPSLTEEQILDAVGLVDDELLQEADAFRLGEQAPAPAKSGGNVLRYAGPLLAMAACVGIVFGMTKLGLLFNPDSMMGTQQSAAPATGSEEAAVVVSEEAAAELEEAAAEEAAPVAEEAQAEPAAAETGAIEEAMAEAETPAEAADTEEAVATESAAEDSAAQENRAEEKAAGTTASKEAAEAGEIRENEDGTITLSLVEGETVYREETADKTDDLQERLGETVAEDDRAVWYLVQDNEDMSALIRRDRATGEYTVWTRQQ